MTLYITRFVNTADYIKTKIYMQASIFPNFHSNYSLYGNYYYPWIGRAHISGGDEPAIWKREELRREEIPRHLAIEESANVMLSQILPTSGENRAFNLARSA